MSRWGSRPPGRDSVPFPASSKTSGFKHFWLSSEFHVHSRTDASDNAWDVHAHGCVRQSNNGPAPVKVDIAEVRGRCSESFDKEECNRRFADCGYHYGT